VWVGVLLTGTQLIQKVRSFAEHADADAPERSYSWRPSLAARLVLWPYNIQYHREHHARPHVPWHRLPAIASAETPPHVPRSLRALLWSGRA
jgi:fatty acid desaturase